MPKAYPKIIYDCKAQLWMVWVWHGCFACESKQEAKAFLEAYKANPKKAMMELIET